MSAFLIRGTLLATAAVLAACGSTTSPGGGNSPAASTSASASSSAAASGGAAAALALNAGDLPPDATAGALTQISDGLLSGMNGTDQRVFANSDHSWAIEIDVIAAGSTAAATAGYPSVRDAAKGRVTTLANSTTTNLQGQSDEFSGTASNGASIAAISFQEGAYVVAVLVESKSATVDPNYALQVATVQDSKIKAG
jgi:hypothetical protein